MIDQIGLFAPEQEARRLRDEGIRQAAEHAGDDWGTRAYALLLQFIAQLPGDLFMTEDARFWSAGKLEAPPDARAWGHVTLRAVKARVIAKHGYAPQKDPRQHMSPGNVWSVIR